MMVKKKFFGSNADREKNYIETAANKDNTTNDSGEKETTEELTVVEESESIPSETETGKEPVSDKKIHEETVLLEKLAEMQDKYLRLSAEFDNYRKRTLKEKMDISKYAGEELLKDILPVMDDFERALKHMESSANYEGMKEGIDLIYVKLSDFLKRFGVREIESLNSNFNVDLHDAAAKVPVSEEDKKGKIVEVILKGYYLKDKVLRHSQVVIGE
jgi:molecular chaperone GrpE